MIIATNVIKAISGMSSKVGNFEDDLFTREMLNNMEDFKIESPIEQILYTAIKSMCKINMIGEAEPMEVNGHIHIDGIIVTPQYSIGKYRADFKVEYVVQNSHEPVAQVQKIVIVECDSQEFHDRDEPQRRYEKNRDRDMQNLGYKVFRFTGAEIVKDPYRVAAEIIADVTGNTTDELISSMENF